jgi:hypothetical protein
MRNLENNYEQKEKSSEEKRSEEKREKKKKGFIKNIK